MNSRDRWPCDGLFEKRECGMPAATRQEVDRSTPIVPEIEQIQHRRNCLLNSRAQIFDGSVRWFFAARRKNCGENSAGYHGCKPSSWSEGSTVEGNGKEQCVIAAVVSAIVVDSHYATLAPRLGRRTALTFPLLPPPQKNRSPPSASSPDTPTPGGISSRSWTSPV